MFNAKNNNIEKSSNQNNNNKINNKIFKKEPRKDLPTKTFPNNYKYSSVKNKLRVGGYIPYNQPRPINLMYKFNKNTKNKNNKKKKYNKILDFLLHPYKMSLNNQFYSIFPTSFKIVRMAVYSRAELNLANGDKLLWYPYGIGNRAFMDSLVSIDFNGHGPLTKYSNLYHQSTTLNNILIVPITMVDFPCRQRLIGASFRFTNTTNVNTKSGNIFITKNCLEDTNYPTYFPAMLTMPNGDFKTSLNNIFSTTYNNAAIKNNVSALQTVTINEVNTSKGNDIFCAGSEYLSDSYKRHNLNSTTTDDFLFLVSQTNRFANNVVYKIDVSAAAAQSVLIEQWQIVELMPAGESVIAGLAHDSDRGCSNNMLSILDKCNPIEIHN